MSTEGYGYLMALTEAIERWGASMARSQPGIFAYRGADLRYAAERSLFFEMVHNAALQARYAAGERLDVKVSAALLPRRMRYEAGNLSRLFRPRFVTARLNGTPDILFLSIHPKFVTFLKPIADALGPRAAYLTVDDKLTEADLEKRDLPVVSVRRSFSPRLVRRGADAHWVTLSRAFDQISAMMDSLKPAVVVVPEGNAPYYELAHRAGLQRGIATIYMQHGAPAYTNPGFRNWSYRDALVWGSRFIEPFARHNPQQKFTAIGTPAVFGTLRQRGREPIRSVGFFLQKSVGVIPPGEWTAMLAFIGWLAGAFPDVQVLVREHPTQPRLDAAERALLGTAPNLHFMPAPDFSLSDVLSACDVAVAAASTTLLEAVAVGAIPFILGTAYPQDFPDIASEGAAVSAPTLDAAQVAVTALIGDENWRLALRKQGERLRPELFAAVGQEAARRIAAFLRDVAEEKGRG